MRNLKYGIAGVFYDMIEQEYRAQTAIAGSDAKKILPPLTPSHYAAHMAGEIKREPSKAMLLGTMAHVAVLEPKKLDTAFVQKPEGKEGDYDLAARTHVCRARDKPPETNRRPTQAGRILEHLRAGNRITALEALDAFGCFRLAARIHELRRDGWQIEERTVETPSGKRVAEYWL
jgi:hypothetical protein